MTRAQIIDAFVHDLRFAWRTLGRQKGWTAVAIITLALGIGATTGTFSVANAVLLEPLPFDVRIASCGSRRQRQLASPSLSRSRLSSIFSRPAE